jgi:DNA-binding SARP family transcriptional activator
MKLNDREHTLTKRKIEILRLFFFLAFSSAFAQEPQYGLKFNSNSYEPEMRTSLDLSPNGFLSFREGFSLSFDVKIDLKEIHSYGYIFRIIDKTGNNIDLLLGNRDVLSFSFSMDDSVFSRTFDEIKLQPGEWLHVQLRIDVKKEELEIRIENAAQKWKLPNVRRFQEIAVVFGKNNYTKTMAIDVPDMTIKDVKIENHNAALYHWKLSKYVAGGVYDEIRNHFAQCENPHWILTQNTTWKKETTFIPEGHPYIAYNPDKSVVAVAGRHFFYTFSLTGRQLNRQVIHRELAYTQYANQMIYNPLDSNYYAYNLLKEEDGREFAPFNRETGAWAETTPHNHYSDYWHHNRYFSAKNNQLYIFGGYGHIKYKKGVYLYDVASKTWSKKALKGDNIDPRYLSGLGEISPGKLLLFGGYGSKTGNQELFPQHYYDAYTIDTETMEARKLWELNAPDENFVVSNSLVVDTANNCFYALCFPFTKFNTSVMLYKFSLTEPRYEIMADTIPFGFKDAGSYIDLFLDKANNKLIAVTSSSVSSESTASVSIHSLSCPPLSKASLYQPVQPRNCIVWITIATALSCLLSLFIILFYRKKKRKPLVASDEEVQPEAGSGITTIKPVRKQALFLFGGFRVIDRDGNDLAAEFKPLLKSLFLLILLNTIKNGRGISFIKLKEILWFDMNEENANNNRGVALSKIRKILENVGEVRFLKQASCWSVEFGSEIYCDYYEALILIRKIKESKTVNQDDLKRLISIVSEGEFLPNIQIEWIDAFKSDFSDKLVDLFMELIHQKETPFSDFTYIDIANALFIHDPLNEDALKLKCSVLVKMGKNGLAKNTYTSFVKEYAVWFGTDYKYSFSQIIE